MYGVDSTKKIRIEDRKRKNPGRVFGLFQVTQKTKDAVQNFKSMLPKFKIQVYSAYRQWRAHTTNREALDNESVITIEDYQQNMEVEFNENPTAMAFSSNKTTVALYPVCIEYKVDDIIKKGGVIFIRDDKKHNMHQVAAFEKRMFEIIRENIPHPINHCQDGLMDAVVSFVPVSAILPVLTLTECSIYKLLHGNTSRHTKEKIRQIL